MTGLNKETARKIRDLYKELGPIKVVTSISSDSSGEICDCLENKAKGNEVIASEIDVDTSWASLLTLLINNADDLSKYAERGLQDDEPLLCDTCQSELHYMPWHYSKGDQRHLHACDSCWPDVQRDLRFSYFEEFVSPAILSQDVLKENELLIRRLWDRTRIKTLKGDSDDGK